MSLSCRYPFAPIQIIPKTIPNKRWIIWIEIIFCVLIRFSVAFSMAKNNAQQYNNSIHPQSHTNFNRTKQINCIYLWRLTLLHSHTAYDFILFSYGTGPLSLARFSFSFTIASVLSSIHCMYWKSFLDVANSLILFHSMPQCDGCSWQRPIGQTNIKLENKY